MKTTIRGLAMLCLALTLANPSSAQKYQMQVGKVVKDKIRPDRFIGKDDSGNVYMSGIRYKYNFILPLLIINYYDVDVQKYIKKYDNRLRLLRETPVITEADKSSKNGITDGKMVFASFLGMADFSKENMSLQTVQLGGKHYIVAARKEKKKAELIALEADLETGKANNALELLKFSTGSKQIDSFSIRLSPDKSKAMILASITTGIKKTGSFAAAVVDQQMNLLWSKEFVLPKEKDGYTYKSFDIGNDGNIYIMARAAKNRRTAPTLAMITVNEGAAAPVIKNIKFGSNIINDGYLATGMGDKPTLVGFYKDKPKSDGYEGIYFASVNEDGSVSNVHKKEFSNQFIASVFNQKTARKAEKADRKGKDLSDNDDYLITDFHRTDDGGHIMVAENYKMYIVTRTTKSGTSTTYRHAYGDLIIAKLDKAGELEYMQKVAKSTLYADGLGIKPFVKDYAYQPMGGYHYFIFNDNAGQTKNTHAKGGRDWSYKADATFIVKVGPGGLEKNQVATKGKYDKFMFNPHTALYQIDQNKLAFVMTKGRMKSKKTRMGTLTIN